MQNLLRLLCWLSISAILITCRPDKVVPDPLTDGKPRIVSIRFPGIPEKNVNIDQKNLLITIRVPPVVLANIIADVQLSENARMVRGGCNAEYEMGVECIADENQIGLAYKDDPNPYPEIVTRYRIKQIAEGPLEVGVITKPIVYLLWDLNYLYVPMINVYANERPKAILMTNEATGEQLGLDSTHIFKGFRQYINHVGMDLEYMQKLIPGTYKLDFVLKNGDKLRMPQPVVVKAGLAWLEYESYFFYGLDAPIGTTVPVEGYNLFSGDIALEITDREGKMYSLPNLVFERYGLKMGIPIPADLPTGQYVMRMYQFGVARPACFRLNVRKGKSSDARIGTIGDEPTPCSLREPVRIGRNIPTNFTYSLNFELPNRPRLKLVPADGNPAVYYGSVVPYVLQPEPIGPAKLTIGSEVPPGRFSATVQYLDKDGQVVAESEPYGRLLEVY